MVAAYGAFSVETGSEGKFRLFHAVTVASSVRMDRDLSPSVMRIWLHIMKEVEVVIDQLVSLFLMKGPT